MAIYYEELELILART